MTTIVTITPDLGGRCAAPSSPPAMDDMSTELASTEVLGKRKRSTEVDYNDNSSKYRGGAEVLELSDDDDEKPIKPGDDDDGAFLPEDADGEDDMDDTGVDDADLDIYQENQERFPEVPAYDEDIPRIKQSLTNIVKGIHDILVHKPSNSIHINRFQETGSGLLEIPAPPVVKIALLGDAGTGKSSLLNSLIDCPDLARALAGGESCTSVPCEYTGALPDQKTKFAAEVTYFDMAAVKDLLKEHLDAYYLYVFNSDNEWDQGLKLQYKRRSDTALKTFRSIFREHTHFKTDEAAKDFLKANRMKTMKVLELMHMWCKAIYEGVLGNDGELVLHPAADTKDDFRQQIDPMVNPTTNNDQPALWPLVKFVRIGVKDSRMLRNATLADLPGISDTNVVKVNATNDYLRHCHGLWIVARMDRVVSDTTVDSLVARFSERFADNIAVIATRSDDNITPGLASYLKEEKGMHLTRYDQLNAESQQIQLRISQARRTLASRMKAKPSREREIKVRKVQAQLDKALNEKAEIDNERGCLLVEARNKLNVQRVEQEMKGHLAPEQKLPVFCVSNHHYLVLKGAAEPESFQLTAAQTGIPALREHALTIAAHGLQQVLDDYIKHHLHVYLRGVWMWVASQYVESSDDLKKLVKAPQHGLDDKLTLYLGELRDDVDRKIGEELLSRSAQCSKTALGMFERKRRDKHWATILAFMRKDGNYATSACPKESWNEGFLEAFSRIIRQQWSETKSAQGAKLAEQMHTLVNDVGSLIVKIRQRRPDSKLELKGFQHMIEGSIVGILNAVRDHQARYKLELSNIKSDATQDRHTGYFTKAMKDTYDRCKSEEGKGCVARSTGHMANALDSANTTSPFDEAANAIVKAINDTAEAQAKILQEEVMKILEDIFAYFDGMITEGVLDPKEHDVRMKLKPFLEKAMMDFKQLQKDLDGIKTKYVAKAAEAANKAKQVKGKGTGLGVQAPKKAVGEVAEKVASTEADKDDDEVGDNTRIKIEKT